MMNQNHYQEKYKTMLNETHQHFYSLLEDLTADDLNWKYESAENVRSIQEIVTHHVNVYIYGLKLLKDRRFEYTESTDLDKLVNLGKEILLYYNDLLSNAQEEDLNLKPFITEGETIIHSGSLGWVVHKLALHNIHHGAQITLIRSQINKPLTMKTKKGQNSWFWATEEIIQAHDLNNYLYE